MRKVSFNKKTFELIYKNNSNTKTAEILGVSSKTVERYAQRLGIAKGQGNAGYKIEKFLAGEVARQYAKSQGYIDKIRQAKEVLPIIKGEKV